MKYVKLILAALCVASIPLFVAAADDNEKSPSPATTDAEKMAFQHLDANKDGAISSDEAQKGGIEGFEKADANKDGKLTLSEYVAIAREEVSSL